MKYKMISSFALISVDEYTLRFRDTKKFIEFCKKCRNYGLCWVCPPFDFDATEIISKYKNAYIVGTKIIPEDTTSTDVDWVKQYTHKLLAHARMLLDEKLLTLEKLYADGRAFYAGTCFACDNGSCTRAQGKPCINPNKIRYSLEAFGFDIGKTTSELLNIALKWSNNGLFPEYYTLVSGFFTNHNIGISSIESVIGKQYSRSLA